MLKLDISEASTQREADIQRFNLWKEALFQDLDEIDKSLRSMAPSPQKVDLLRTMIHRVDQIRASIFVVLIFFLLLIFCVLLLFFLLHFN